MSDRPSMSHFNSADINQVRTMLNRFYYPISVGAPEGHDSFKIGAEVIQLGPMTIGHLTFGAPVTLIASELDAYHVTIPTTGRMQSRHAGREVLAHPSTGAVFGPGNPVYTLHSADSSELDVKIERPALEAELAALLGHPIEGPLTLPPEIDVSGGPGLSWSRLVRQMHDECGHSDSLMHQPPIAGRMRRLILSGLLYALPHNYHDELTAPPQPSPPRAVRRAQEAIEAEPERAFTVADLAEVARVSVRSLQDGFRKHAGCSPMSYLQRVRLQRAHEDLLHADPAKDTVASIAHRWGFAHLGRFASAYRARFDESPSETLRR
ncbi:AraC family transcriptional regulator [Actinoplanes sp. NPDC049265]|uniref:helix-turn-helix transcriptional regulator n=1 Tax=Actinoplanes sp. NPDC049265 TaxID=3363902 RepID=UPI003718A600